MISETQFGFTDDLGVQDNYLPGGHIHSGLVLTNMAYSSAEGKTPEKFTLTFTNEQGILDIDILAPDLARTKPKGQKSKEQMYDFFKRLTNNLFIGIAKAFKLDTKKLPASPIFKTISGTLQEALQPELKANPKKKFHIKLSKNKEGFAQVGSDGLFIEPDNGQETTLFFSDREKKMNLIERQHKTEADPGSENLGESPEVTNVENLEFDELPPELKGENLPDPFA